MQVTSLESVSSNNFASNVSNPENKPNKGVPGTPTFETQGQTAKALETDENLLDKMIADLLKRIIVFNDKIEEMQRELFLNNNVNLVRVFKSFDQESKGFLN